MIIWRNVFWGETMNWLGGQWRCINVSSCLHDTTSTYLTKHVPTTDDYDDDDDNDDDDDDDDDVFLFKFWLNCWLIKHIFLQPLDII